MSSREIATLCGKRHSDVKRDIELLAAQLEVDVSKFGGIYTDSQNRQQTEYLLDKDTCLCLVAGYYAHHEISDPRFGKVKTYHVDILAELFQMQNLI